MSIDVKQNGASTNHSRFRGVARIVLVEFLKEGERPLHRWDIVGTILDEIDGQIVGDGSGTPWGFNVHKVCFNVEHVILHYGEKTHGLAIVVKIIASNNVRISPYTTDGTGTLIDPFVEGRLGRDLGTKAIVDIEHRVAKLIGAGLSPGNALALETLSVAIVSVAERHPSFTAISRSRVGVVPFPLAAVVLHRLIDLATSVPTVTDAEVAVSAIALAASCIVETTGVQFFIFLEGAGVADARGILVYFRKAHLAVSMGVTLGSFAAVTNLFAFVVPRDAALVIHMGIGEARGVILILQFAVVTAWALGILDAKFRNVVWSLNGAVVVASGPGVALRHVGCGATKDGKEVGRLDGWKVRTVMVQKNSSIPLERYEWNDAKRSGTQRNLHSSGICPHHLILRMF